jgi:hypothetical protein
MFRLTERKKSPWKDGMKKSVGMSENPSMVEASKRSILLTKSPRGGTRIPARARQTGTERVGLFAVAAKDPDSRFLEVP